MPAARATDRWLTPADIAALLGRFDLDVCSEAGGSHIQADRYYSLDRGEDGLVLPWEGRVFCNPPYSAPLAWARRLAAHPGPWVALVKMDPTTRWWRALFEPGVYYAPFNHRLRYEDRTGETPRTYTARFPSVLVWHDWWPSEGLYSHLLMPDQGDY